MHRNSLISWISITYGLSMLYVVTAFHYLRLFERNVFWAVTFVVIGAIGLSAMILSKRVGLLFAVLGFIATIVILVMNLAA